MKKIVAFLTNILVLCSVCFANPVIPGSRTSQKPPTTIELWSENPTNIAILASFAVIIIIGIVFIIKKKKK